LPAAASAPTCVPAGGPAPSPPSRPLRKPAIILSDRLRRRKTNQAQSWKVTHGPAAGFPFLAALGECGPARWERRDRRFHKTGAHERQCTPCAHFPKCDHICQAIFTAAGTPASAGIPPGAAAHGGPCVRGRWEPPGAPVRGPGRRAATGQRTPRRATARSAEGNPPRRLPRPDLAQSGSFLFAREICTRTDMNRRPPGTGPAEPQSNYPATHASRLDRRPCRKFNSAMRHTLGSLPSLLRFIQHICKDPASREYQLSRASLTLAPGFGDGIRHRDPAGAKLPPHGHTSESVAAQKYADNAPPCRQARQGKQRKNQG